MYKLKKCAIIQIKEKYSYNKLKSCKKIVHQKGMVIHMSKIMVAGFIQIETIVKVDSLPLSDKLFTSIPGMIDTSVGGDGFNTAVAIRWLGDDVDFMLSQIQSLDISTKISF